MKENRADALLGSGVKGMENKYRAYSTILFYD